MPLLSCFSGFRSRGFYKSNSSTIQSSALPDEICRLFSFAEIKAATNNFHHDLFIGEGEYGKVYKGFIDNGSKLVAVSRLNTMSLEGAAIFKTEVRVLCQLRHSHIVSLIGICDHGLEIIIVYDYMANGTLQDALYGTNPLSWKQRLKICIGAARGLHYLHSGAKLTILHRDVKPRNILLDENWVAKVSNFGLSKLTSIGQATVVSWPVEGNFEYLEPEYWATGRFWSKTDVYSFGVVLFEVLCAKKPFDTSRGEGQVSLIRWAERCVEEGTIDQIIDPHLLGKITPDCLERFVETAASCVFNEAKGRPAMGEVVESLENALEIQDDYATIT